MSEGSDPQGGPGGDVERRARKPDRRRETRLLRAALEALTAEPDSEAGLVALVEAIREALECDGVALLEQKGAVLVPLLPEGDGASWDAPQLVARARRIADARSEADWPWPRPPGAAAGWRSMLTVPVLPDGRTVVLVAHDGRADFFSVHGLGLLQAFAPVVANAILRRGLERRNAFLAGVVDGTPTPITIAEASDDQPLVYVNDAFEEMTGFTREEALGRNCRMLAVEAADDPARKALRETIARREAGAFVLRNGRKDGTRFWNELRIFPLTDARGEVTHLVGIQSDVSDRVLAEQQRDEARGRLEGALSATSEGFLILGRDGRVQFVNDTFEKMFGDTATDRDGRLPPALATRLLGPGARTPHDDGAAPLSRVEPQREVTAPDGRLLLLQARPMPDGGIVLSATDVTQLKVSERILRQRLAAIENSRDGIAIGDADGRIVDVNASLTALWGLEDPGAALGRRWTAFYDGQVRDRFDAAAASFRRTGTYRHETPFYGPENDRTHEISLNLVPEVGIILVVRDITDRVRDASERDGMRRRLERAQTQEQFQQIAAGLAHDFNNLLSAVLGSAALLETAPAGSDAATAAIARIQAAARRAAGLVDGLLDLSVRERSAEPIDLVRVLADTVDLARGGASPAIRLMTTLPETPLVVEASQTDLLQVVMNLVVNAIDALGSRSGDVGISLQHPVVPEPGAAFAAGAALPGMAYAAIEVTDSGPGMSAEVAARAVEPYYTTRGNEGTGLGLAIVASILGDAGGMLAIDTEEGRGTKMTAYWPLDVPADAVRDRPAARSVDRSRLPILVLDDDPEVAEALAAALGAAGFEVAQIDDPEDAICAITEDVDGWGCLVTDYDMPAMNGGELVERLSVVAPQLPVIVVSALARRLTDRRLRKAVRICQKPVDGATLVRAVQDAIGPCGEMERETE